MDDVHVPLLSRRTEQSVPVNGNPVCMPSDRQRHYKNPSIYRVPACITSLEPEAYQPKVVSFGPYHYGEVHLFPMEEHKRRVLGHFLRRSGKSLHHFLESLREVAQDLEDSYEMLDKGTRDQFLNLMTMDGVFMLEIMRTTVKRTAESTVERNCGYDQNDPIFSIHRLKFITPYISRDMLLLENQLPMEVLYRLVKVENNGEERDEYVNELVLKFYSLGKCSTEMGRCLHVLDVFRKGLLPKPKNNQHELKIVLPEAGEKIIRSATELREAGIVFKKSKTNSLNDISFDRGVLRLPVVLVDGTTESKFLNTMTFERLHIGVEDEVTSYVAFMDKIINNEQDVALLHTKGIIQNAIGSNVAVAELFNSLCMEVTFTSTCSLEDVQKRIHKYCDRSRNRWRAKLSRDYFGSPWSTCSFIAAFLLFWLTVVQTVYAILSYK